MQELHLNKKDFRLEWYSGEGGGGQHRNKKKCCCRITHIDTGISAVGTASRHRRINQKAAFGVLAARLIAHYADPENARRQDEPRVRTYHAERNIVLDHASGLEMRYGDVVRKANLGPMIDARRRAKLAESSEAAYASLTGEREEDCGCPAGAEETCINILCPRK